MLDYVLNLKQSRQLYDCYIECNGKRAIEDFKNVSSRKLRNYNQIQDCFSFGGRLRKDVVLVDIDEMKQANVFFEIIKHENVKCRVYRTDKGMHFLFKNDRNLKINKSKLVNVLGLTVDIKTGNASAYESLKIDGVMRELIYDIDENEKYDDLPKWAMTTSSENATKLFGMSEGDGRNDVIHRYIWSLQCKKFTVEEVKHTIKLINKFVFKTPLDDSEIEVLLRDESFMDNPPVNFFDEKGRFLHYVFAKYLIDKYTLVSMNRRILFWENGVYKHDDDAIERIMRQEYNEMTRKQKVDVWDYIRDSAPLVKESDKKYIVFENGIYNDKSDSLEPFDKEKVLIQKIPWEYDPNVYSKEMDDILNDYADGDPQKRTVFEEMLGACITRRFFKCYFILTGVGDNGKSALLDFLRFMLGEENTSTQPPDKLSKDFGMAALVDKIANIADDIHNGYIANASILKNLSAGGRVRVQEKYKPEFEYTPCATHVFAANDVPLMEDSTGASSNRMIIIPLTHVFKKVEGFVEKVCKNEDNIKYLVRLAIEGLKRLNKNGFVSECQSTIDAREEFRKRNNPMLAFIDDCDAIGYELYESSIDEAFDAYQLFCNKNNYRHDESRKKWTKDMCGYLNANSTNSRVNGKQIRIFRKEYA